MKSKIFHSNLYKRIQKDVKQLLNRQEDFLSAQTANSTRAVGDAIERIIADNLEEILGDISSDYQAEFPRKAMADVAFKDGDDLYYIIDVKTHRKGTRFNMSNLVSVQRLSKFYEDDTNYFTLLIVKYSLSGTTITVSDVHFVPIEFLSWDCLTIGALGWGQIQLANSSNIIINEGYSRKKWMLELCDVMSQFYPKEIDKITDRADYFGKVRRFWESKPG